MTLFGKRLRFLRLQKNLTQNNLAKILNTSTSAIGMYERGEREPSLKTLLDIAQYFGVSTDYLLGNDSNQQNSFPKLDDDDEKLLQMRQEYPRVFQYILNATPEQLNQLNKIIKALQ